MKDKFGHKVEEQSRIVMAMLMGEEVRLVEESLECNLNS